MQDIHDILNLLSPDEVVVYLYHKVLKVDVEKIPDQRWRFKISSLDTHRCLNRINMKLRKNNIHEERIAALQEMFYNDSDFC